MPKNPSRRAEILAWVLYDWANSAYSTLLITLLLYYVQEVVLPGKAGTVAYAGAIAVAMLLTAVLSPVIGAVADAHRSKHRWLAVTALGGSGVALCMAAVPSHWAWLILPALVATNLLFDLSMVPYNGFLREITDEQTINRVSAWGFAAGYLGGSVPLALFGLLVWLGPQWGLPGPAEQGRVGLIVLGLWWGLFSLPAVLILRDRGTPPVARQPLHRAVRQAVSEVRQTLANVRLYPVVATFLLAYLFYNDGIQTVITQANTLAVKELQFPLLELVWFVLMIQLVALPGTLALGWLADRFGAKLTLLGSLAVWVGLLVAAMFVQSKTGFWIMGAVLALVLGGTQAVSRALMGLLTPAEHAAEFFGFFNLSGKAASFLGPAQFALVMVLTNSPRVASASLLVFFILGALLLARVTTSQPSRPCGRKGNGGA